MSIITEEQLRQAAPLGNPATISAIVSSADEVFRKYKNTTLKRVWGFGSIVLEETGGLRLLVENLHYSAERAHQVWPRIFPTAQDAQPYANDPQKLANKVYGGRMGNVHDGDGWKYRGQGLIQITGSDNFAMLSDLTGLDLVNKPELVTSEQHMLECAVALFVRYPGILEYCDLSNWHAVWALVGSGKATGQIINLPEHEMALAHIQKAIPNLGSPAEAAPPTATPKVADAPPAKKVVETQSPASQPPQTGPSDAALSSFLSAMEKLTQRIETALFQKPKSP